MYQAHTKDVNEMTDQYEDVMNELERMINQQEGKLFEPYIRYIRFPLYKHLKKNSRIDFGFPITALVGPNGCNKSSILQALFGAPINRSVGNYWFSTDVDRISKDSRHCFIYGYKSQYHNRIVEVLKTRIQKKDNPDYWEPSRPQKEYDMEMMPTMKQESEPDRSKTRWNAINKEVLYLDFRHNLPAFDRYFYHMPLKKAVSFKSKQDYIRRYSKNLHFVIVNRLSDYSLYNEQKVRSNTILSKEKVRAINTILGKEYEQIQIVEHSLYGGQFAKTVVISDDVLKYSEAFAGSGESSVIILVDEIMDAKEKSLILLDEPETSLHPMAQKRMVDFICEAVKRHRHQVVISTHSPFFIQKLPPHAIKTLLSSADGIEIMPSSYPEDAFALLGAEELAQKTVFVEDKLSVEIVKRCIKLKHPNLVEAISVRAISGGAETIISRYIYPYSQTSQMDVVFLLDGDKDYRKKKSSNVELRAKISSYFKQDRQFDQNKIPVSDNPQLDSIFQEITGVSSKNVFCIDGSKGNVNEPQKYAQIRGFLSYWFRQVCFLSSLTPENAIIESLSEQDRDELCLQQPYDQINSGKAIFEEFTRKDFDDVSVKAKDILTTQRRYIARLDENCPLFQSVENALSILLK